MPLIKDVRLALFAWARNHGILADNIPPEPGGDPSLVPFPDRSPEFFRTRKIVRIVADTAANRIVLFSRLRIAKTKQDVLRESFNERYGNEGLSLTLDAIKPFKIDQAVESFGRFEPIRRHNGRIACGSSIGLGNQRNAGTLTALAQRASDPGAMYGISCNHVTGGCGTARPGTPVVMPGIQDISEDNNEIVTVGDHESAALMGQGLPSVYNVSLNRDMAFFQLRDPNLLTSMQGIGPNAYDTPTRFAKPKVGMSVKKWGRSTRFTKGEVSLINTEDEPIEYNVQSFFGPLNSQYFRGTVYFSEVIEISSSGAPFSLGGDSGALVVTDRPGHSEAVVGILIAGEKTKSLVLPLQPALRAHRLKLISGHNI